MLQNLYIYFQQPFKSVEFPLRDLDDLGDINDRALLHSPLSDCYNLYKTDRSRVWGGQWIDECTVLPHFHAGDRSSFPASDYFGCLLSFLECNGHLVCCRFLIRTGKWAGFLIGDALGWRRRNCSGDGHVTADHRDRIVGERSFLSNYTKDRTAISGVD